MEIAMAEDEQFQLGELTAKIDLLSEKIDRLQKDVDQLKYERAHIIGVGAAVSFRLASVGFLFGDGIRSLVKRSLGN